MADETALERQSMVVHGDRSELRLESGHITVHKDATTQVNPTEVTFAVTHVRGATLETPPRGGLGWLHVAVVGGSPPPPTGLAAAGDPYTLPITSRGTSAARKMAKMIERHVQARGKPSEARGSGHSTGVILNPTGEPSPKNPYAGRPTGSASRAPERATTPISPAGPATSPSPPPAQPTSASPPTSPEDDRAGLVGQLRELADLHAAGALSDDEFQRAKDRLLG